MNRTQQRGAVNAWLILSIVFAVTTVTAAGFLIWALTNYYDQKDNVDTKVSAAVATAQKEQERVQILPKIINVAVPAPQHSPMFGQFPLSQIVCNLCVSTRLRT